MGGLAILSYITTCSAGPTMSSLLCLHRVHADITHLGVEEYDEGGEGGG